MVIYLGVILPKNDKRYRSSWPLPGGWRNYLKTLHEILLMISRGNLTFDELVDQVSKKFEASPEWVKQSLLTCIVYPSLAIVEGGRVRLTGNGHRFLETGDGRVVLECLEQNIWGVRELLCLLKERPMTRKELFEELRKMGAPWGKDHQVRFRLQWLRALGAISVKNERYQLTESGKEFVSVRTCPRSPEAEGEGPPRPPPDDEPVNHDRLVNELLELGKWLGFDVEKERRTPGNVYRLDVVWMRSRDRPPVKAFEVELSQDVDKALTRLKVAHYTWNCEQLWLVVSDEASAERARRLVDSGGIFGDIRDRVKILIWEELHKIYKFLKDYKEDVLDLMKR
ncbi:MAG: hypothetical protein RQ885_04965 [Desulfurococcales archaeon]|nr:hypothetical protein [Desulfurococcales archaeon]